MQGLQSVSIRVLVPSKNEMILVVINLYHLSVQGGGVQHQPVGGGGGGNIKQVGGCSYEEEKEALHPVEVVSSSCCNKNFVLVFKVKMPLHIRCSSMSS